MANLDILHLELISDKHLNLELLYSVYQIAKISSVSTYMEWRPHTDIDDTKSFILAAALENKITESHYLIFNSNSFLGIVSIINQNLISHEAEMTIWLDPQIWGKGVANTIRKQIFTDFLINRGFRNIFFKVAKNNFRNLNSHLKLGSKIIPNISCNLNVRGVSVEAVLLVYEIS